MAKTDLPELKVYHSAIAYPKGICRKDGTCITKAQADEVLRRCEAEPKLRDIIAIAYEAICTGDQEASDKAIGLIEDLEKE